MSRIFGPVASRRLGRSLGIDVIPYKTCSFDCVYCECGKTTDLSTLRREFYPLEEILEELRERLSTITELPDVITFSGAGEPTLYSRLGELIMETKKVTRLPVAVITNSSLFGNLEVRNELMQADILLPSLDSAIEESFKAINRPHRNCDLEGIIKGMEELLSSFTGRVYMEILLIEGFNSDEENLHALKTVLDRLKFDSIQLNTAVRPGTLGEIEPISPDELGRIRRFFGPRCEIIARTSARAQHEDGAAWELVLKILERRPSTAEDLHLALGIPVQELVKHLAAMRENGLVATERKGKLTFYTATERAGS